MKSEDQARRFINRLHIVMEETERADKRNPACCENLSAQEMKVLCKLEREKCCIMSAIADGIRLSLSSVTALVDRLVERKLVRRDRSVQDRRVVEVALTDQGQELSQAALEGRVGVARRLLEGLSASEQEALLASLDKLAARIQAGRA